ncbi:uncharacterized protein LOC142351987 [Convolutriloba macropyga]|uniref:uncharacterized protein LOC142351987 n=1 Tax=Convolutriloba macropyga TaxID=536237 RepID=UPI003F51F766
MISLAWLSFMMLTTPSTADPDLNFQKIEDVKPYYQVNIEIAIGKCIDNQKTPEKCVCFQLNIQSSNPKIYDCCVTAYDEKDDAVKEYAKENKDRFSPEEVEGIERSVLPWFVKMLDDCSNPGANWSVDIMKRLRMANAFKPNPSLVLFCGSQFLVWTVTHQLN